MTGSKHDDGETKERGDNKLKQVDETRLLELLEQARQSVKQLAKRAVEGEVISDDLLNMRMRLLA